MGLLLAFSVVLLLAVYASDLARRSVLSTAVLFLVAGFVLGDGVTGLLPLAPGDPLVGRLAELALFSVLFTDGMRIGLADLRSAWRLPGRALLLGMPLTFLVTAVLALGVAGLPWVEALLLSAVLAPTDPVFASAIVGREEVPYRLRHLLNVESGLNDGLALPVVVVLVDTAGARHTDGWALAEELVLGVVVGVGVPLVAVRLGRRLPAIAPEYRSIGVVAIGLLVLSICQVTHANLFLGAFSAGVTLASLGHGIRESFERVGDVATELLKLAAILVFGLLVTPAFLGDIPLAGYLFAVLALLVARPAALAVALLGSRLSLTERAVAAWFGPKGFASVVYGLLVLDSGTPHADELFHLVALVVAASIVLHSSSDVPIAHRFARAGRQGVRPARG